MFGDHKMSVNDALWEAAVRHSGNVSVSSCFLTEVSTTSRCLATTLVQNAGGAWEPAVKTNVVISRSPWWHLSCDDDVWLHEQATMNRAATTPFVAISRTTRFCDCDPCRRTT